MKHTTIIDIAKELGISKSTVSRALSGDTHNVKPETMRLINETATRMGYQRNEIAVNLRRQSSRNIGIIIPEIVTSFFMNFIQHAQKELRQHGYRTIIAVSNEDPEQEAENLMMLQQCRVEGILMSVCHKDRNSNIYNNVKNHGIPIVFFDRKVEGIEASTVRIDDYLMAFFMVERMIRSGCRKIVHLTGPDHISNGYDRHRGYREALEKFSIPYDKRYAIQGGLSAEEGAACVACTPADDYNSQGGALFGTCIRYPHHHTDHGALCARRSAGGQYCVDICRLHHIYYPCPIARPAHINHRHNPAHGPSAFGNGIAHAYSDALGHVISRGVDA